MQSKAMSLLLVAATMATLAVVAVPAVSAQAPPPSLSIINLKPPAGDVKPEIGQGSLTFTLDYHVTTNAQPAVGAVATSATVTVTASCQNPNIFVQGPNTVLITIDASKANSPDYQMPVTYQVTANRQAPGLQLQTCTVTAKASSPQGTAIPDSNTATQNFQVTIDYFPLLQATVAAATQEAGPQKAIPFAIDLTNFGNAQTQVSFALAGAAPDPKWANVILPSPILLDSPTGSGGSTKATATFTVNTPYSNGWNNQEHTYQLTMTPSASLDNTKTGLPIQTTVFARSRGIYVPGPEPALMLLGVLGAGMLARMARRDD